MIKRYFHLLSILILVICGIVTVMVTRPVSANAKMSDQPQTVPTSSRPMVTVRPGQNEPYIKVRSGPNTIFPQIGILAVGQEAPAKGVTSGGDWVLIEYPGVAGGEGWVYTGFVSISPGDLPIVEPVATPMPLVTQTIDPTLAAQFMVTYAPTRLPTFTQPAPLVVPTYTSSGAGSFVGIPVGLIIILLGALGIIIGLISFLSSR